jgi:hypothetical protein
VKGSSITFTQLATEWLLQSSTILQNVFVTDASVTALRKAEQFLWAGSEMDSVSSTCVFCMCFNKIILCCTQLNTTLFWDVGSGYGREFD